MGKEQPPNNGPISLEESRKKKEELQKNKGKGGKEITAKRDCAIGKAEVVDFGEAKAKKKEKGDPDKNSKLRRQVYPEINKYNELRKYVVAAMLNPEIYDLYLRKSQHYSNQKLLEMFLESKKEDWEHNPELFKAVFLELRKRMTLKD